MGRILCATVHGRIKAASSAKPKRSGGVHNLVVGLATVPLHSCLPRDDTTLPNVRRLHPPRRSSSPRVRDYCTWEGAVVRLETNIVLSIMGIQ